MYKIWKYFEKGQLTTRKDPVHDSLENAFSEHLEWLKFQRLSESSALKPLQWGLTVLSQDPQVVSHIVFGNEKIRHL